ncbi:hypothetical protein M404DRAFT_21750 [Pisolithus tinctorius Marx 270]|uniref:Uncharacterized protein n=1 Tax=Pisolithus tinctorius Marx 270 TaxID=870435 RepID=A0A0C3PNU5_PISTI|nr:hypothetical protein M404DRAFT_21750 [Pisolithus tinctorius Marx 270]
MTGLLSSGFPPALGLVTLCPACYLQTSLEPLTGLADSGFLSLFWCLSPGLLMAPDRSCSLRTHFIWLVSHLWPPLASDTPWVALCYSPVTHLAFRPLPPPGTTPVLYPSAMVLT